MPKKHSLHLLLDDSIPSAKTLPETESVRFHLFKKQRELFEINQVLRQLAVHSNREELQWLQDNDELVVSLAESFVDDSLGTLEGKPLDGETMKLSLRVMSSLKKTLNKFENLISTEIDELEV